MCAMALLHARVKRVVYGARDPKAGAAGSVIDVSHRALNHTRRSRAGVLESAASDVLKSFFAEKREQYRQRRAMPLPASDTDTRSRPSRSRRASSIEIEHKPKP